MSHPHQLHMAGHPLAHSIPIVAQMQHAQMQPTRMQQHQMQQSQSFQQVQHQQQQQQQKQQQQQLQQPQQIPVHNTAIQAAQQQFQQVHLTGQQPLPQGPIQIHPAVPQPPPQSSNTRQHSSTVYFEDPQSLEPLSCTACRARKLRCDRIPPACTRCVKGNTECIYPPSRRRPAVRRRNVKELEARLAQVEELLHNSNRPSHTSEFDYDDDLHLGHSALLSRAGQPSRELMEQGMFEPLPSSDVLEELNEYYFGRHYYFVPVVHPGRYREAYYSAPHRRPPLCLQYAIWANASHEHPKYSQYHEFFYSRARQYAERDEMKGQGEHFLTLGHAQAWVLIATEEARSLQFTRAAMSSARCIRLVQMMGLHRMDSKQEWSVPVLAPSSGWVESEERRRTFWSAYCIDSHASLSTGWPGLINSEDIGTRLPCSEEAFTAGNEEMAPMLNDALAGAAYSTFAGAVVIAYLFNAILRHVNRPTPNDNPGDLNGSFWARHNELDLTLNNAFKFLPQQLRLPDNITDPSAVHTNLHLYAGIICLHHQAVDCINENNLGQGMKQHSERRLLDSAAEIVALMKTASNVLHVNNYKSPLISLSMFCAASVYVYHLRDSSPVMLAPEDLDRLYFILSTMERLAADHIITRSFLQQLCSEIERHHLRNYISHAAIEKFAFSGTTASVPLISRGRKLYASETMQGVPFNGLVSSSNNGPSPPEYVPLGGGTIRTGVVYELSEDDQVTSIYSNSSQRLHESSVEISSPASSDSRMSPHSNPTTLFPRQGSIPRQSQQSQTQAQQQRQVSGQHRSKQGGSPAQGQLHNQTQEQKSVFYANNMSNQPRSMPHNQQAAPQQQQLPPTQPLHQQQSHSMQQPQQMQKQMPQQIPQVRHVQRQSVQMQNHIQVTSVPNNVSMMTPGSLTNGSISAASMSDSISAASTGAPSSHTPPDTWTFSPTSQGPTPTFVDPQYTEATFTIPLPHRPLIDMDQTSANVMQPMGQMPISGMSGPHDQQQAGTWTNVQMFNGLDVTTGFGAGDMAGNGEVSWDMVGATGGWPTTQPQWKRE